MIGRVARRSLSSAFSSSLRAPAYFSTSEEAPYPARPVPKSTIGNPVLPGLSDEQLRKIGESDAFYRSRHDDLEYIPDVAERDIARRKRVIYRSKQRGWLEADILMGAWAVQYVPTLSDVDLDDYEILLKEETIDIYNYISGKDELPDHLKDLPVMKQMQAYAKAVVLNDPEGYSSIKRTSNLT